MADRFAHLPAPLARALRNYLARKRLLASLVALFTSIVVYVTGALLVMHLDRFLFLTVEMRGGLSVATHLLGLGLLAVLLGRIWLRRPSARLLAYEIEARMATGERLVTLEDLARHPDASESEIHRALLEQLQTGTLESVDSRKTASLAREPRLRGRTLALLGAAIVCSAFWLLPGYQFPLMVQRFLSPQANLAKPSFVRLTVLPGNAVLGKGDEVIIQAELEGEVPRVAAWLLGLLGQEPDHCLLIAEHGLHERLRFRPENAERMNRVQRRLYISVRRNLQESFSYRLRFGDAQTETFQVEVIPQPQILTPLLALTPPEYTGLPERTIDDLAQPLRLFAGSRARLTFSSDQPLRQALIQIEGQIEPIDLVSDGIAAPAGTTFEYAFSIDKAMVIDLRIINDRGFANLKAVRLTIGLREDQAPTVRLEEPAQDIELVPGEVVQVRAAIQDDLGVVSLAFQYMLNPDSNPEAAMREVTVEMDEGAEPTRFVLQRMFDLDITGAGPGDDVLLQLRARDAAGNDGTSQPVMIRVVAFTRGEHERRRLLVLDLMRQALADAVTPVDDESEPRFDPNRLTSPERLDELRQAGARAGVATIAAPTRDALLDLLELEHHLTERAIDKAALRQLHVVLAAVEETSPVQAVTREILPPLQAWRTGRNLVWRLFSLRTEAARMAAAFTELHEEKATAVPPAFERRAALYLKALQDTGEDVLGLARTSDALSEGDVAAVQEELNINGYYMSRDSVTRRTIASRKLPAQLDQMMALVTASLPTLLQQERLARLALQELYQALPVTASEGRLAGRNPFAPMALQVQAHAAGTGDSFQPPASAVTEATWLTWLAWQSELRRLEQNPRIDAAERRLHAALLAMEARSLRESTLSDEVAATWLDSTDPAELLPPTTDLHTALRELAAAARPLLTTPAPVERFKALKAEVDGLTERGAAVQTALAQNAPIETVAQETERLVATFADLARAVDLELGRLSLALRLDIFPVEDAEAVELAWLELRQAHGRFRMVGDGAATSLRALLRGGLNAESLMELTAEARRLGGAARALSAGLETALAVSLDPAARAELAERYLSARIWPETRHLLQAAMRVDDAASMLPAAEEILARVPAASLALLTQASAPARQLAEALDDLTTTVKAATLDATVYAGHREQVTHQWQQLRRIVDAAVMGDATAAAKASVEQLAAAVQAVPETSATLQDARNRGRLLLQLDDLRSRLASLILDLDGASREIARSPLAFRGGPDGLWDPETPYQKDADEARTRIGEQFEVGRRQMLGGWLAPVLSETFEPGPLLAWAAFTHRLARSDLTGAIGRQAQPRESEVVDSPLVRWLMEQVQSSRLAARRDDAPPAYRAVTLEYLDSLADYLRY